MARVKYKEVSRPHQQSIHRKCPKCGNINAGEVCLVCGTAKSAITEEDCWTCTGCGHENAFEAAYCVHCGKARKGVNKRGRLAAVVSVALIILAVSVSLFQGIGRDRPGKPSGHAKSAASNTQNRNAASATPATKEAQLAASGSTKPTAANTAQKTLKKEDLNNLFQSDSYWKMTQYSYDTDASVLKEYYVQLGRDMFVDVIVNAEGDDLRFSKFSWEYDDTYALLRLGMLEDGYGNDTFLFEDGKFVCNGAYYKTELTQSSDTKIAFENARNLFEKSYGGYNPAKRLVTTNAHFRYMDISEWNTMSYDNFRYYVMNKSYGLVMPKDAGETDNVVNELASILGGDMAKTINTNTVLFGVDLSEKEGDYFYADSSADVINLVYTNGDDIDSVFWKMHDKGEDLLHGLATGSNITANDIFEASFYWNDANAVTIYRIGQSIIIFRGPTQDIKTMTEFLSLGDWLWY